MSDLADRITGFHDGDMLDGVYNEGVLSGFPRTEYICTDIHAAAIARAEAAEAALAVAEEALNEAIMQIEYLDERSPSGTSPTILARIRTDLAKIAVLKDKKQ